MATILTWMVGNARLLIPIAALLILLGLGWAINDRAVDRTQKADKAVYEAKIDAMALEEKAQQDKDTKMAFTKTDASAQTTQKITNAQKNAIRKLTDEQLKNPGAAKCVVSSGLLDLYAGAIAARSGAAANAGSLP